MLTLTNHEVSGKISTCQCRRHGFSPWVGKIPWRREWLPTPVFLPGEPHRQRSLADNCPWGCKELDKNEQLNQLPQTGWFKTIEIWDFPGGLLVTVPCYHCRGTDSIPGQGTKIPNDAANKIK